MTRINRSSTLLPPVLPTGRQRRRVPASAAALRCAGMPPHARRGDAAARPTRGCRRTPVPPAASPPPTARAPPPRRFLFVRRHCATRAGTSAPPRRGAAAGMCTRLPRTRNSTLSGLPSGSHTTINLTRATLQFSVGNVSHLHHKFQASCALIFIRKFSNQPYIVNSNQPCIIKDRNTNRIATSVHGIYTFV
jgi:hypothetical protein